MRMRASSRSTARRRARRRASSRCSPPTTWRDVQAAARDLAHEGLLRDADPRRSRATRCAMSASRSSASWRRAAISPRTPLELIEIEFEPLPAVIDPAEAALRRRAAAARGSRHQRAGRARVQARRCRRRDRAGAGAGRRPLPHAPQDRDGDRAARLPRRIRAGPRRAHAAFGDAGARHHPRRAGRGARPAGSSPARRRARRRRRLRRQGLALSGGDLRLRGGAPSRRAGQMDQRPPGGPHRHQPGLRRDHRRRARARSRRPHAGAARRRDRRRRRLFDLSVDRGARAGAGRELPARPLSHRALSRPRAGGRDLRRRRPGRIAASGGRSRPS